MSPLRNVYSYFAYQCWMAQKETLAAPVVLSFVTISRQAGAGGITIGEKLADYLNKDLAGECPWTVFDKNLVHEVIKEHHLSQKILPFLKEANIPEIEDTLENLLRLHPPQFTLVQRTTQTILHLAKMGRVVLVGRGSPVITKEIPGGVHVRLVGSFKKRRDHIKEYFQLSDKEAELFITNEDNGRAQYLKKYFNKDIDDPLFYDLVINTDTVSYDDAALLIADRTLKMLHQHRGQNS